MTIKEYRFTTEQLTATGSYLDAYSPFAINGAIKSISLGSNNFVNIGSLQFYFSGTDNEAQQDLILRIRAGSMYKTYYPLVPMADNQGVTVNVNSGNWTIPVGNAPIRVVGSGVGDGKSGTYISIKYI